MSRLVDDVLIVDGAMGTMLHAAGNSLDRVLPELNLTDPELVATVHAGYIGAGADVIETNTWGANQLNLKSHGSAFDARELNLAGAEIARRACDVAPRTVYVAGAVSPAVTARQRRASTPTQRISAIKAQVAALIEGGVDIVFLETFGFLADLVEAVRVVADLTDLPIFAHATFCDNGMTLGGESPREVATALAGLPVAVIGTNCTLGPQGLLNVVTELCEATDRPVSALPNAGVPRRSPDGQFHYRIDGDYIARYARAYTEAGARLVGGCCGTTPDHIQAIAAEVRRLRLARSAPVADERPYAEAARREPEPIVVTATDVFHENLLKGRFITGVQILPSTHLDDGRASMSAAAADDLGIDLILAAAEDERVTLSSTSLALHLQDAVSCETAAVVSTWNRTIMTLQADLLGAHALGLRTIVCQTGTPAPQGGYPNADGIWDVDSVGLVSLLASLNSGSDCSGLPLANKTAFLVGARCNPGADDIKAEVVRVREKLDAGAEFLLTRPVYDSRRCLELFDELGSDQKKVLITIAPLASFAQAEFLAHEVPDAFVDPAFLERMERTGADAERAGIDIAREIIEAVAPRAGGVLIAGVTESPVVSELIGVARAAQLRGD